MKKQLFTFIIFSCLLLSCQTDRTTNELKQYLKDNFGLSPANGSIYLFIPSSQCHNCILLNADGLSHEFNKKLFVFSALPDKHFAGFLNFYRDKQDKLQELKLVDYENKFVFFNNNRVSFVIKANINSLQREKQSCPKSY